MRGAGLRLGKPLRIRPLYLSPPVTLNPVQPFGFDAHVGPKGSGKSLLAVHRARRYAQGLVKRPDGRCTCGDLPCANEWSVFTNMAATWKNHERAGGKGWAEPIDVAADLLRMDSGQRHVIFLLDEAYQYADSRRSMLNTSLEITDQITQSRKTTILVIATGISFDWFDNRIRAQTRQVYNCWSPNGGQSVYAVVTLLSVGHLPPWKRQNRPTSIYRWDTQASQQYYDTYERIDAREELKAARGERQLLVRDGHGQMILMNIAEIVDQIVFQKASDGLKELDLDDFTEELVEVKKLPVTRSDVARLLSSAGFYRTRSDQFVIQSAAGIEEISS